MAAVLDLPLNLRKSSSPEQLDRSKGNFTQMIPNPNETYRKVGQNFGVSINACLNCGGAHIENINYKAFAQMPIAHLGLSLTLAVTY